MLFHHEPVSNDARIAAILNETQRLDEITRDDRPAVRVSAAYDGMELDV